MNKLSRIPLVMAVTLLLVACGEDKNSPDYNTMGGDQSSSLPNGGGQDQVGGGATSEGIPASTRGNFDPSKVDNQTLASDTIYFGFDKSTIDSDERGKLQAVSDWFKSNPGHELFLAGHADKRGTPEYNRALGERRAESVREYLAGLGIPPGVIHTTSYGSDRPAVDGDTEEAFAKNRRVEIGVVVVQP